MNTNVIDNFAAFAERAHKASVDAGWYTDLETGQRKERNIGELFCLMHSEVSEAMEGYRKSLMDDKLPHRPMIEVELADALIRIGDFAGYRRLEAEVAARATDSHADVAIDNIPAALDHVHSHLSFASVLAFGEGMHLGRAVRKIVRIAEHLKLDLDGAIEEKMAYNAHRADHKIENRKLANGKAF